MEWRGSSRGGIRLGTAGGIGIVGVIVGLMATYFGVSASSSDGGTPTRTEVPAQETAEESDLRDFVTAVLGETGDVWRAQFAERQANYREPRLVLFRDRVQSECGIEGSAVGPFYCPPDERVYLDLGFLQDLRTKDGASGEFAQAYVIAHEVGHHVQELLGIPDRVRAEQRVHPERANDLSVRLELQADFLAGVFAHDAERVRRLLDRGDLEEELNAASRIGDDVLRERATGHVTPDSFTHGTAEQRVRWLRRGMESGRIEDGDTFSAQRL
jgi:predicted metalloprotease